MAVFQSSDQFYGTVQILFDRVQEEYPQAADDLMKAKLLIRFKCIEPEAIIMINGRRDPVSVTYGENRIRPEVDVHLTTDTLHFILLGELKLSYALASKKIKVHGPARKVLKVVDLFHQCQSIYPEVLHGKGM